MASFPAFSKNAKRNFKIFRRRREPSGRSGILPLGAAFSAGEWSVGVGEKRFRSPPDFRTVGRPSFLAMPDLKRLEAASPVSNGKFFCLQAFYEMQKKCKLFAGGEIDSGKAASCRLALLSRGGVERLIWLRILPHTFRFLYGRETVLPCYARFKAARSRFSCIKCQVLLPASLL